MKGSQGKGKHRVFGLACNALPVSKIYNICLLHTRIGICYNVNKFKSNYLHMRECKEDMRFEIHTDYAIRILRYMYVRGDEVLTAMEIAQATGITSPIFTSIASQLKRAGILKTVQGRYGGYIFSKPANEISLYDVFVGIEGEMRINRCLETGGLCEHGKEVECKVHGILYGVQDELIKRLSNVFISDLV